MFLSKPKETWTLDPDDLPLEPSTQLEPALLGMADDPIFRMIRHRQRLGFLINPYQLFALMAWAFIVFQYWGVLLLLVFSPIRRRLKTSSGLILNLPIDVARDLDLAGFVAQDYVMPLWAALLPSRRSLRRSLFVVVAMLVFFFDYLTDSRLALLILRVSVPPDRLESTATAGGFAAGVVVLTSLAASLVQPYYSLRQLSRFVKYQRTAALRKRDPGRSLLTMLGRFLYFFLVFGVIIGAIVGSYFMLPYLLRQGVIGRDLAQLIVVYSFPAALLIIALALTCSVFLFGLLARRNRDQFLTQIISDIEFILDVMREECFDIRRAPNRSANY